MAAPIPAYVQIGDQRVEGEEEALRDLFMAAAVTARRGGYFVISPDVATFLSPATPITIHIPGGFTDEFNPSAITDRALRARPSVRL